MVASVPLLSLAFCVELIRPRSSEELDHSQLKESDMQRIDFVGKEREHEAGRTPPVRSLTDTDFYKLTMGQLMQQPQSLMPLKLNIQT